MRYASVCDGIGAAHVAFAPLGWACAWRSEIDPFPKAVVARRWPSIGPDLGDMTKITDEEIAAHGPVDLLCGGTPCQSFSVAGLRKSLADDRGNLALVFLELARRTRAEWLVWENVPGVLSSNGGRDFGAFLGALVELGYGFAYRVLDAQFFGLAQRRKRVFVVARLGDWRAPAAVLLERACLRGDLAPSREAGEDAAGTLAARASAGGGLGTDFDCDGGIVAHSLRADGFDASEDGTGRGTPLVAMPCLRTNPYNNSDPAMEAQMLVPLHAAGACGSNGAGIGRDGDPSVTLDSTGDAAVAYVPDTADPICANEQRTFDNAGNNAGRPHNLIAFDTGNQSVDERVFQTLRDPNGTFGDALPAVAFTQNQSGDVLIGDRAAAISTNGNATGRNTAKAMVGATVRRLTPVECARLQGFPDNYLDITFRGKPAADGPKYRALGNSWAVPVVAWIGRRIEIVETALRAR